MSDSDVIVRAIVAAAARERAGGATVQEIADRAGVSHAYVHRVLAGGAQPTLPVACALARAVGLRLRAERGKR